MKIYKNIFSLFFLFICIYSQAQITFQKYAYTRGSFDVQQTNDTGYVLTGIYSPTSALVLIKLNSLGDTLWSKDYAGVGIGKVRQTTDGGYIIVGGNTDIKLVKTNSIGDTLWTKAYGTNTQDVGVSVEQTTDGGYLVTGSTNINTGNADICVVKTNAIGDTLWTKIIGGNADDKVNDIKQTIDGGYIITGTTESFGAGNSDVLLIKMNSLGIVQWAKTFGETGFDVGNMTKQLPNGDFLLLGKGANFNSILIQLNNLGDTLWTKSYGIDVKTLNTTSNNGFIMTNGSGYYLSLININSNGDTLWTKAFYASSGNTNYGNAVQQTFDGGFIIAGTSDYDGGAPPSPRGYIIKTDSSGNGDCYQASNPVTINSVLITTTSPTLQVSSGINTYCPAPAISNRGFLVVDLCSLGSNKNQVPFDESFNVSPNPSSGVFQVSMPDIKNQKRIIIVTNVNGQQVLSQLNNKENKTQINLSSFPDGIYFLKVVEGGRTYVRKLMLVK